jgi:mycoredoxin
MTLYHVKWCPECALVRERLAELNVQYDEVVVPDFRPLRRQVHEVSGQYYVPVLKDGEVVLTETREILEYLERHYEKFSS